MVLLCRRLGCAVATEDTQTEKGWATRPIDDTIANPDDEKHFPSGKSIYWNNDLKMVVIVNPADPDGGTAFVPTGGYQYIWLQNRNWYMGEQNSFRFSPYEVRLLHNSLNEVLHGFALADFERAIGEKKSTVKELFTRFCALADGDELTLSVPETRVVRNALRETIRELGIEEFQTRTDYNLDEGKAILRKLDRLLRE
jgi:hypothetical protein